MGFTFQVGNNSLFQTLSGGGASNRLQVLGRATGDDDRDCPQEGCQADGRWAVRLTRIQRSVLLLQE